MSTATTFSMQTTPDTFRGPGEFGLAVIRATTGHSYDPRLAPLAVAGSDEHSGISDPRGGFAVPTELAPDFLRIEQDNEVLGRVTRLPMRSSRLKVPARVDKDHSSSVTGGVVVVRRPETHDPGSVRMEFEQVGFHAETLEAYTFVTDELLADSEIEAFLELSFRDAVIAKLMTELVFGTGVGEMLGILNSPALITIAKEGGQAADTIVGENITKMAARCWGYDRGGVWLANPDCREQLTATHIAGTNSDKFLYQEPATENGLPRLHGRPLVFSEYASTVGDLGDLILLTPSEYVIAERSRNVVNSMHFRYENATHTLRFTMRNDGAPWWREALTPANGANTLSPYITLAERA